MLPPAELPRTGLWATHGLPQRSSKSRRRQPHGRHPRAGASTRQCRRQPARQTHLGHRKGGAGQCHTRADDRRRARRAPALAAALTRRAAGAASTASTFTPSPSQSRRSPSKSPPVGRRAPVLRTNARARGPRRLARARKIAAAPTPSTPLSFLRLLAQSSNGSAPLFLALGDARVSTASLYRALSAIASRSPSPRRRPLLPCCRRRSSAGA